MIKLSTIIVSYNNPKVIVNCLESILMHNDILDELEVIVVEQSPSDEIYNMLTKRYIEKNIMIIRNENYGFGCGNNKGEEYASGKYLLFLNPDTILVEPIFKYAISVFEKDARCGLFGMKIIDLNGRMIQSYNDYMNYGMHSIIRNKVKRKFNPSKMYIVGADIFIRHDLFTKIGRFDSHIFMYNEETDLCIRVRDNGFNIKYVPEKRIIHLEGKSTDINANTYKNMAETFVYVANKHNIKWRMPFYTEMSYYTLKLSLKLYKNANERELLENRKSVLQSLLTR